MKKSILVVAALLMLSGCNMDSIGTASSVIGTGRDFDIICIDGVEYLIRGVGYKGFMSVHMQQDGKPFTCKVK
jgi:predicted small secreted protein